MAAGQKRVGKVNNEDNMLRISGDTRKSLENELKTILEVKDDDPFMMTVASTIRKIMSIEDTSIASFLLESISHITQFGLETFEENELGLLKNLKLLTDKPGELRVITEEDITEIFKLAECFYQLKEPEEELEYQSTTLSDMQRRIFISSIHNQLQKANEILSKHVTDTHPNLLFNSTKRKHSQQVLAKKLFPPEEKDITEEKINENMKKLTNELGEAVTGRKIEKIIEILKKGVDPNKYISVLAEKDTLLIYSIFGQRDDIANILLKNGADPNALNNYNESPLLWAINKNSNISLIKSLLIKGANPNAQDRDKLSALELAIVMCNDEVVNVLLEYGADASQVNSKIEELLLKVLSSDANSESKKKSIHLLLKYKIDSKKNINLQLASLIDNPYRYSTNARQLYVTHLVEQHLVDPFIENKYGIDLARTYYPELTPEKHIIKLLELGWSLDELCYHFKSASAGLIEELIIRAAYLNRTDLLYTLLLGSTNKSILQKANIVSAISKCIMSDTISSPIVLSFLEKFIKNSSILPTPKKNYHERLLRALNADKINEGMPRDGNSIIELKKIIYENPKVYLNVTQESGINLLELAYNRRFLSPTEQISNDQEFYQELKQADDDIFFIMLKHSNVDVRYSGNQTLLHLAIHHRVPVNEFLMLLLVVNPEAKDAYGKKPMDYILNKMKLLNTQISEYLPVGLDDHLTQENAEYRLLSEYKKMLETNLDDLFDPDSKLYLEMVKILESPNNYFKDCFKHFLQMYLKKQDQNENTLLHRYLISKKNDRIKKLLETSLEISINTKNRDRNTALHLAILNNDLNMVELLLKKGASLIIQNFEGMTPLHLAVKSENIDIVKLLLRYQSPINFIDEKGNTPLHYSILKNTAITKLLLENHKQYKRTATERVDPNRRNTSDMSVLELAISQNDFNTIKLILENCDYPTKRNSKNETPMMQISKYVYSSDDIKKITDLLIRYQIDPKQDINLQFKQLVNVEWSENKIISTPEITYFKHLVEQYGLDPFVVDKRLTNSYYPPSLTPEQHLTHLLKSWPLEELAYKLRNATPELLETLILYAAKQNRTDILYDILTHCTDEMKKSDILTKNDILQAIISCLNTDVISAPNTITFITKQLKQITKSNISQLNPADTHLLHDKLLRIVKVKKNDEQLRNWDSLSQLKEFVLQNQNIHLNVTMANGVNILELLYHRRFLSDGLEKTSESKEYQYFKKLDDAMFFTLLKYSNPAVTYSNSQSLFHLALTYNAPPFEFLLFSLMGINPDMKDHFGKKPIDYISDQMTSLKSKIDYYTQHNIEQSQEHDDYQRLSQYKEILSTGIQFLFDPKNKLYLEQLVTSIKQPDEFQQKLLYDYLYELIIKHIHKKNTDGNTLLHQYINSRLLDHTQQLLTFPGVDINVQNKLDNTALHLATFNNDLKAVELLLRNGASTEIINKSDYTPLHIAINQGNSDIVALLLEHKASINILNTQKNTTLHFSIQKKQYHCMELILKHNTIADKKIDINSRNLNEDSALDLAVKNNDLKTVKLLLENGADPSSMNSKGYSALHHAIESKFTKITDELLKNHKQIENRPVGNIPPLHWAISKSAPIDVILSLIAHGADVNEKYNGTTPLHLAAMFSPANKLRFSTISLLLEHGADPNAKDKDGKKASDHSEYKTHLFSIRDTKRLHTGWFKSNFKKGESHLLFLLKSHTLEDLPFLLKTPYPELLNALIKYAANTNRADVLINIFTNNYTDAQLQFLNKKPKTIQKICHCLIQDNTLSYITKLRMLNNLKTHAPASSQKILEKAYKNIEKGKVIDNAVSKKSFFRIFKKQGTPTFFTSNKQYYNKLLDAVQRGLFNAVESLHTEYKNVNYNIKSLSGETLLDIAYTTMRDHQDKILDAPTETLRNEHQSEFSSYQNTVYLLLDKVNINDRTIQNKTVLHLAIEKNAPFSDVVMLLLLGANKDLKDAVDKKALDYLIDTTGQVKNEMKQHKELLEQGIKYLFKPENLTLLNNVIEEFSQIPPVNQSLKNSLYKKLNDELLIQKTKMSEGNKQQLDTIEQALANPQAKTVRSQS